jgi:hypothetical protein
LPGLLDGLRQHYSIFIGLPEIHMPLAVTTTPFDIENLACRRLVLPKCSLPKQEKQKNELPRLGRSRHLFVTDFCQQV